MCVGNYTFIWDGNCPIIQPRKYQIPDGTYTSITFADGCIVAVGQAPVPVYTPQQCCDGDDFESDGATNTSLVAGNVAGNLARIQNGEIEVKPVWDLNGNIVVKGNGTADNPWKPSLKISQKENNTLTEETDGLFANLFFKSTDTVTVEGDGTKTKPYKLTVLGADAKLPKINKTEIEGNGFTIDEFGRWKADDNLNIVTNLTTDHPAFTFVNRGSSIFLMVDDQILRVGAHLIVGKGLSGKGNTNEPLAVDINADLVGEMLAVIDQNENLKQRLKSMLGV